MPLESREGWPGLGEKLAKQFLSSRLKEEGKGLNVEVASAGLG